MNKLQYSLFDSSNTDIAYSATNGYSDPPSEELIRKQLSYPLKEVKTFVNNTVSVKEVGGNDTCVQLVLSENDNLQYRTDPDGELHDVKTGESSMQSFVGMVVMGVNLTSEAVVQGIYGPLTRWTELSQVILASKHVVGNGKGLALTNGTTTVTLYSNGTSGQLGDGYGKDVGVSEGVTQKSLGQGHEVVGVPTKNQLSNTSLDNSGLIVETKDVHVWERTL